MSRRSQREAILVRGLLEGGGTFEWWASQAASIYVGSSPRCEWRVAAAGVAPFHWQLCWYGRRLWMAELAQAQTDAPRKARWTMAPIGSGLRLGAAVLVLETSVVPLDRAGQGMQAFVPPRGHSEPTLLMDVAPSVQQPGAAGVELDPDATCIVDADALRALPVFGPPPSSAPERARPIAARPEAFQVGSPSLADIFIVPAAEAAPPPRGPSPLTRLLAYFPVLSSMPARVLIGLIATGISAAVVFLPESLATRSQTAPAGLPARRVPAEAEIEVRAVQPDPERDLAEASAARDLAAGRLEAALRGYRELQRKSPDDRVFRDFVAIIERRVKGRCKLAGCAEEEP